MYSSSFFGILVQTATFGVIMPLYFALHLFTSPVVLSKSGRHSGALNAPSKYIDPIPIVFILGFLAPSALVSLPAPSVVTIEFKQQVLAFWQAWPVWVSFAAMLLAIGHSKFVGKSVPASKGAERHTLSRFRRVYAFAFTCSAIPHMMAWTLSLTSTIFPVMFSPQFATALHPTRVFVNVLPWSGARASSVGEGALWFLQWDWVNGTAALLLWSIALYIDGHRAKKIPVSYPGLAFKVLLLSTAAGPSSAAVELIWERDELFLGAGAVENDQKALASQDHSAEAQSKGQ
jgi:hypothetical protein